MVQPYLIRQLTYLKLSVESVHIYSMCRAGEESSEKYRKALTVALSFLFLMENSLAHPKLQEHQKERIRKGIKSVNTN